MPGAVAALCLCAAAGTVAVPTTPAAAATTAQVRQAPALHSALPRPIGPKAFRFALPEPSGPYAVGTVELHLVDRDRPDPWVAGRSRELMVSVWYPAKRGGGDRAPYLSPPLADYLDGLTVAQLGLEEGQVDAAEVMTHARIGAPLRDRRDRPVVLYSPGGGNPRHLGTTLVEDLASRGYVVVTMDHTYETPAVEFPGGRVATQSLPSSGDSVALNRKMIDTRVKDTRFVLDALAELAAGRNPDAEGRRLPSGLGRALDLTRIGMFGHSAGGFTAGEAMLTDRRIDAGADLDGSMAYSMTNGVYGEVAERGLDRPFMLMGAGMSRDLPHTHRDAPDWKSFWERSTGWKLDVYMAKGEHSSYTDFQSIVPQLGKRFDVPQKVVTDAVGTVDPARSLRSQRAYVTAFFDEHLRGRPQPLLDRPSPLHPDVELVP
ncbi:lipase [Streptosporangium sp. 'caverna']|nr:lipase [Streptosporangium sp. 'caverna']